MELSGRAVLQKRFFLGETDRPEDALELLHRPVPAPSPHHVIVRMIISVVNPVDIAFIKESRLSSFMDSGGAIPGSEGVGIIHEVGEGVLSFQKGQRVVPVIYWNYLVRKGQGAWQDFIEVAEEDLVSLPESIGNESASLFVINPWTVYGLLWDLAIPKGEFLLQTTGASVIGRLVIQLGKHRGIKTINVIRREEWRKELDELGADEIINSANEDIATRVFEITQGKGAYAAIDMLSGNSTKVAAACVRDFGDVYVYGTTLSPDVAISASDLRRKVNVTFWGLTQFLGDKSKKQSLLKDMPELIEKKILSPLVGQKFALSDVKQAIIESQKSGRGGKVLLVH